MRMTTLRCAALAAALAFGAAGCASNGKFDVFQGAQTNSQKFYAAQGEYNALEAAAVTYAQSPDAQRSVVTQIANVNRTAQVAIRAGNTYYGCAGDSASVTTITNCTLQSGLTVTQDQNVQVVLQSILSLEQLLPDTFLNHKQLAAKRAHLSAPRG